MLVNQWDWNRQVCGERMPAEMTFADLRRGTDVEFGLSVYEPFGISQLEPLSFGALCVVSSVCGCLGFARRAAGGSLDGTGVIEADFLKVPRDCGIEELKNLSTARRDEIETAEARRLAGLLRERLSVEPAEVERRLANGYELAGRMNWQRVVEEYFLPSLASTAGVAEP